MTDKKRILNENKYNEEIGHEMGDPNSSKLIELLLAPSSKEDKEKKDKPKEKRRT